MHRHRALFRELGTFFAVRSWAGCITNMFGFDLRQAQANLICSRSAYFCWLILVKHWFALLGQCVAGLDDHLAFAFSPSSTSRRIALQLMTSVAIR
jgi:hypothetical protein